MSSKDPHVPWTEGRDFAAGINRDRLVIPKHLPDHPAERAIVWPGMQFQLLTTPEPDLDMCATAIGSLEV